MVHELEYWYAKEPEPRGFSERPRGERVFPCEIYIEVRRNTVVKGGGRK